MIRCQTLQSQSGYSVQAAASRWLKRAGGGERCSHLVAYRGRTSEREGLKREKRRQAGWSLETWIWPVTTAMYLLACIVILDAFLFPCKRRERTRWTRWLRWMNGDFQIGWSVLPKRCPGVRCRFSACSANNACCVLALRGAKPRSLNALLFA